jgi:hypothetical protein
MLRKSYDLKEKRSAVQKVDGYVSAGYSLHEACFRIGISCLYYRRWVKNLNKVDSMNAGGEYVSHKTNGTARKIHADRKSILAGIKPQLSRFILQMRGKGIQLTNRMVCREASRLLPAFRNKTTRAKDLAIHRFTKSVGLTQRAATHTSQKHFSETEDEAKDFIAMMKTKVQGRELDDILNMDQTPIPYSYHASKTLDIKGKKTIHARASTTDTKRVTLAATVTASGKMLAPFLIFKGKPNGRIATREFGEFPDSGKYACQEKAWMNEAKMHEWVDVVLAPWKAARDAEMRGGDPPLLILDAYRVHQMGSVVNKIQSMGIEVVHIPAGCTYLCQPIDIGINKPIKTRLRDLWEQWMTEGEGVVDGRAREPSRKVVAEWLVEVYTNLPKEIGENAWKKTGFEWF